MSRLWTPRRLLWHGWWRELRRQTNDATRPLRSPTLRKRLEFLRKQFPVSGFGRKPRARVPAVGIKAVLGVCPENRGKAPHRPHMQPNAIRFSSRMERLTACNRWPVDVFVWCKRCSPTVSQALGCLTQRRCLRNASQGKPLHMTEDTEPTRVAVNT